MDYWNIRSIAHFQVVLDRGDDVVKTDGAATARAPLRVGPYRGAGPVAQADGVGGMPTCHDLRVTPRAPWSAPWVGADSSMHFAVAPLSTSTALWLWEIGRSIHSMPYGALLYPPIERRSVR